MGYLFSQILIMSFICTGFYMLFKIVSILLGNKLSRRWMYDLLMALYTLAYIPYFKVFNFGNDRTASVIGKYIYSMVGVIQFQTLNPVSNISKPSLSVEFTDAIFWTAEIAMQYVAYVWIAGIVIYYISFVCKYTKFQISISRCDCKNGNEIENILEMVKSNLKIVQIIPIRMITAYSGTPFIYGIFRPVVVVPNTKLSAEEWTAIFYHELTHYKRHDELLKLLISVLNALQWFNPLIYYMRDDIDAYCELACDEAVIRQMDIQERKEYCKLMLGAASESMIGNGGISSAFSDRRKLERRIKSIMKPNCSKFKKSARLLASVIAFSLAFLGTNVAAYAAQSTYPTADTTTKIASESALPTTQAKSESSVSTDQASTVKAAPVTQKTLANSLMNSSANILSPDSTTTPGSYWNLAVSNYNGAFSGVSYVPIYTNYYFTPNSNKTIYLDQVVTGEQSSSQQYYIALYDYTTGSPVYQNELTVSSTTEYTLTYNNLNANHFYFIAWKAAGFSQLIDGHFTVRWN